MKKFTVFMLALIATCVVCFGAVFTASAEEIDTPEQVTDETQNEPQTGDNEAVENENNIADLAASFLGWIKSQYGADYEKYYNSIIENWGSVEAYLLQFGEEYVPEKYSGGWDKFVNALSESAPVWAPILAIALVIVGVIVGKKVLNTILNKLIETRIKPIETELNKQSEVQIAQAKATRALLGTSEKFANERKALEEAEKTLSE